MKKIAVISSVDQVELFRKHGVSDLIVPLELLSRFGGFNIEELDKILLELERYNINAHLEWDILMTDSEFMALTGFVMKLPLNRFKTIRVLDPGAAQFLLEKTKVLISPVLEGRNHNLLGLMKWRDLLGERVGSLILSQELSEEKLREYIKQLNVPVEVLGLGRILLFYSPRGLISAIDGDEKSEKQIEIDASSEESPHSGFNLLENRHGTFLFNPKDFSLLEHLEELEEIDVSYLRLDQRFEKKSTLLEKVLQISISKSAEEIAELKRIYPKKLIKGFFRANKSDVLFKKLKNKMILREDDNFIGEVVEVQKKKILGIKLASSTISLGETIKFITPDGKEKVMHIKSLKNLSLEDVESLSGTNVALIPHTSGISVKTQVYKK